MVTIEKENFSLKQICESGQCFRLRLLEEREDTNGKVYRRYGLPAFDRYLEIRQCGRRVEFCCTEEEFDAIWRDYFDLTEDYGRLIASIDSEDEYLLKAASFGWGIRILRQDLWEMIVSFIISQQNNIKRIRKCIEQLCRKYGMPHETQQGEVYYSFPTPEALAGASLEELYGCGLGYRSRYIKETALAVCNGEIKLDKLSSMEYQEAVKELCSLCGVGVKVASCVCLFALHKTDAFPVDTHISKVLQKHYPQGFPFEKYPGYAGSLQQYIFYYDLMGGENFSI